MEDKKKIFIGNISFDTEMEALLELFAKYGEIVDSYRPEGKGFAFITFDSEEAAEKAIEEMNEKEVDGRALVVNIARPKEKRPSRGGYGGGYGGGDRGGRNRF